MTAFVIDAFEFARLGERREGELAVSDLPRLAAETVDASGVVRWSLEGGHNQHGHPQLLLAVGASVQLVCQRCLSPFAYDIASQACLVLARTEASADELEALLDDEDVEVIVASRAINVVELIEDDAMLALPISPRHEVCPDRLLPPAPEKEDKVSPFAVLKDLKRQ